MKNVYVVMVGDLFHLGHVRFLSSAKALGDYLVVGVAPDNEVTGYKRKPVMTHHERKEVIAACRYVDEVIDQSGPTTTEFMRTNNFQIFAYATATETEHERNQMKFYSQLDKTLMVRLPYTSGISTTEIIERIQCR